MEHDGRAYSDLKTRIWIVLLVGLVRISWIWILLVRYKES